MALISKSKVISDIGLFFPSLRKIVIDGWDDYVNYYSNDQKVIHCPTTRANIVHDHQVQRASIFAIDNSFDLLDIAGMKILLIGEYAIRFKKIN